MARMEQQHIEQGDIVQGLKEAFGRTYRVVSVKRLHGGAQKVVYRIECEPSFTCIMYVWDVTQSYFREETEQGHNESYGAEPFRSNHQFLKQKGIPTPDIYYMDQTRTSYPYDYALVEMVSGLDASFYLSSSDGKTKEIVFGRIGDVLKTMHGCVRDTYGRWEQLGPNGEPCHLAFMRSAQADLAYISKHIDSIAKRRDKLHAVIAELSASIRPRKRYGFTHGELGPDHIMLNERLEPYLIDIEGGQFMDIEHEHSFLQFRFGDGYRHLRNDSLDPDRMRFYKLYHHISLTDGGLKLLHRGFHNRRLAQDIVDFHSAGALKYIDKL